MKKFLVTLILTVFSAVTIFAQEIKTVTLQLKSGISITGKIIEQTNDSYKIQTPDGDVFVYGVNEVLRVNDNNLKNDKSHTNNVSKDEPKLEKKTNSTKADLSEKGFCSIVEAIYSRAIGNGIACDRLSVSYIAAYKFSSYFYAGLGLGVALTDLCCDSSFDLPVFLHLRSSFIKSSKVSPFVSVSVGGNIPTSTYEGNGGEYSYSYKGLYINPTLGVTIKAKNNKAVSIGVTSPLIPNSIPADSSGELYSALTSIGLNFSFLF